MLKNRTIAIAILSALLALSRGDGALAATPLATVRVAAKPANPSQIGQPPGDFDRAFIAQQAGDTPAQQIHDAPIRQIRDAPVQRIQTGNRDRGRGVFTRTGSTRAGDRE